MFDKTIYNTSESNIPLTDRLPAFDVSIVTVVSEIYTEGMSKVCINGNINILVPTGLVGALTKRDSFKLYYKLLDDKSIEIITIIKK